MGLNLAFNQVTERRQHRGTDFNGCSCRGIAWHIAVVFWNWLGLMARLHSLLYGQRLGLTWRCAAYLRHIVGRFRPHADFAIQIHLLLSCLIHNAQAAYLGHTHCCALAD